jgi:hypothetical protein
VNFELRTVKLRGAFIAGTIALAIIYFLFVLNPERRPIRPSKQILVGTTTLDEYGDATIAVPSFIGDDPNLTYQIDGMNAAMPGLYVKSKLHDGTFVVAGGTPNGEVAWQLVADIEDWKN